MRGEHSRTGSTGYERAGVAASAATAAAAGHRAASASVARAAQAHGSPSGHSSSIHGSLFPPTPPVSFPGPFSPPTGASAGAGALPSPSAWASPASAGPPLEVAHRLVSISDTPPSDTDDDADGIGVHAQGVRSTRQMSPSPSRKPAKPTGTGHPRDPDASSFSGRARRCWTSLARSLCPRALSRAERDREKEDERRYGYSYGHSARLGRRRVLALLAALLLASALAYNFCAPSPDDGAAGAPADQDWFCTVASPLVSLALLPRTLGRYLATSSSSSSSPSQSLTDSSFKAVLSPLTPTRRGRSRAAQTQSPSVSGSETERETERTLVPGATPFTIVSLLRDMPPEAELHQLLLAPGKPQRRHALAQLAFQWTALRSWARVVSPRHILIFTETESSCRNVLATPGWEGTYWASHRPADAAPASGWREGIGAAIGPARHAKQDMQCFVSPCMHPHFHAPLMDCIFHAANQYARTEVVAYVRAVSALHHSLAQVVERTVSLVLGVAGTRPAERDWMLMARRVDTPVPPESLSAFSSPEALELLFHSARSNNATMHTGRGLDLLVFPRRLLRLLQFEPAERTGARYRGLGLYPPHFNLTKASEVMVDKASAAASETRAPATPATTASAGADAAAPTEQGSLEIDLGALRFPPLLGGLYRWDNWLLSQMVTHPRVAVVDITRWTTTTTTRVGGAAGDQQSQPQQPQHLPLLPPLVVHQLDPGARSLTQVPHAEEKGAAWNDALVKRLSGDSYVLGDIDNANYLLRGDCMMDDDHSASAPISSPSTSSCHLVSNPHVSLEVLLRSRSSATELGGQSTPVLGPSDDLSAAVLDGARGRPLHPHRAGSGPSGAPWVVLVSASSRDGEHVLHNWLCWARRNRFESFLFLAADRRVARLLRSLHVPFVLAEGAPESTAISSSSSSGRSSRTTDSDWFFGEGDEGEEMEVPPDESQGDSLSFLLWKARFTTRALRSFNVVHTSPRTVWLRSGGGELFHHLVWGPANTNEEVDFMARDRNGADAPAGASGTGAGAGVGTDATSPHIDSELLVLKSNTFTRHMWSRASLCLSDRSTQALQVAVHASAWEEGASEFESFDEARSGGSTSNGGQGQMSVSDVRRIFESCLSEAARGDQPGSPSVRFAPLDPVRFPSGRGFFQERLAQMHGMTPFIVDVGEYFEGEGSVAQWEAMQAWGLVATEVAPGYTAPEAEDESSVRASPTVIMEHRENAHANLRCIPIPDPPHRPPAPAPAPSMPAPATATEPAPATGAVAVPSLSQPFHLTIRVLTFNRPASLQRLLSSLLEADYAGDNVSLVVSVDRPEGDMDGLRSTGDPVLGPWESCVLLCRSFATRWTRGAYSCIVHQEHQGLTGQWTRSPAGPTPRDLALILEDDVSVARGFYSWTRSAVQAYYLDPAQFDPRMYGISLQTQHTILGEHSGPASSGRYGGAERAPAALLPRGVHLYRYQLVGTWGTIMFPQHWKEFQTWLADQSFDVATGRSRRGREGEGEVEGETGPPSSDVLTPCVPGLISNDWWSRNPRSVWSAWFVSFAHARGYYSLYTNFPGGASLAVNHRAAGLNFKQDRGAVNPPMEDGAPGSRAHGLLRTFPPLRSLPLYDFFFRRIATATTLASSSPSPAWSSPVSSSALALAPLMSPAPPVGLSRCWTLSALPRSARHAALAALSVEDRWRLGVAAADAARRGEEGHVDTMEHAKEAHREVILAATEEVRAKAKRLKEQRDNNGNK